MIHAELFPSASELPVLQEGLDWCELTENELLVLLAAGPRLAQSANPLDDLSAAVAEATLPASDEASPDGNPLTSLLATIEKAGPAARQALVIVALEDTWASEGVALPPPGLNAQK